MSSGLERPAEGPYRCVSNPFAVSEHVPLRGAPCQLELRDPRWKVFERFIRDLSCPGAELDIELIADGGWHVRGCGREARYPPPYRCTEEDCDLDALFESWRVTGR